MNQSNSSKQVLLSVIGVAILVVAVVGVSFAFFNYTRTGEANTVRTGTIYFNTSYSEINVSNLFPTSRATALTATGNAQASVVGVTEITVDGYTTYANGVDYVVVVDSLTNSSTVDGTPAVPISVNVSASETGTGVFLADNINNYQAITLSSNNMTPTFGANYGTSDANALSLISYEVNQSSSNEYVNLANGAILAKGHIAPVDDVNASTTVGSSGRTHGTIVVKAYIDNKLVAISDTLAAGVSDNIGGTSGRITQGTDTNGTDATWVAGRRVYTTAQWNSFQSGGVSFKIKVIANEGNDAAFTSSAVNTITPLTTAIAPNATGITPTPATPTPAA